MSSQMTYDTLLMDLKNYCERGDEPFVNQLPRFIVLAENRIASETKPFGYLRVVKGKLNGDILKKPQSWRMTKSLSVKDSTGRTFLKSRGYEFCRTYWPDETIRGFPEYYSDYDFNNYLIVPTPASQLDFELQYYERPEPLSATRQTNWLTENAPQVLLYACLKEAMPFLKLSERIPEFEALYSSALSAIVQEDANRVVDSSIKRS